MSNTKKLLWAVSKETAWESLALKNNYMFFKVMQEESKLKELLHRVFPEIRIKRLADVGEKTIQPGEDIHGVRLDIFAQNENGRAFTVEMQVCNQDHLPRRMRYYSSTMDSQLLEKGDEFIEGLHKSVTRARADKKWRAEYMTIEQHDMEMQYIGEKRGLEIGRETYVISLVRHKMQKGISPDEIAEDIMEDLDYVSTLMAAINTCGPTAEDVDVYRYLHPDSY